VVSQDAVKTSTVIGQWARYWHNFFGMYHHQHWALKKWIARGECDLIDKDTIKTFLSKLLLIFDIASSYMSTFSVCLFKVLWDVCIATSKSSL
jgi:hypothetical protein